MTPAPDRAAARQLRAALARELQSLDRAAGRVAGRAGDLAREKDDALLAATGKWLADAYSAVERILRSAVGAFGPLPTGPDWHRELLSAATLDVADLRPPVVSAGTARLLEDFLAFRHVFRSLYAEDLRLDRLVDLAARLPVAVGAVKRDIVEFDRFLERLAAD